MKAMERYNHSHPQINLRLDRSTFDILKRCAERYHKPLSVFCKDLILYRHDYCFHDGFFKRKKQDGDVSIKFQRALENALKDLQAQEEKNTALTIDFEEKNKALADSLVDWQVYCSSIQDKLDESEKSNVDIQADWERLNSENAKFRDKIKSLEDAIQDYKNSKVALQRESVAVKESNAELRDEIDDLKDAIRESKKKNATLRRQVKEWENIVGDTDLKKLAVEVGVSQAEILKDLIEYGYAHTGDIYVEDLEVQ